MRTRTFAFICFERGERRVAGLPLTQTPPIGLDVCLHRVPPVRGHARTDSGASEDGDLYIAVRDHVAVDNELMFLKGEQILVIERPSDDLWIVRFARGRVAAQLATRSVEPCRLWS